MVEVFSCLFFQPFISLNIYMVIYTMCCVVVVITPPLPRDGSTARTATQMHAINLIEI